MIETEDLTSRVQILEFTNEAHQQEILRLNEEHKQAIEQKDIAIALLNVDLQNREYEKVASQAQRDVYQARSVNLLSTVMFLVQKIWVKTALL